jgi:NADH-quinone oxidoreductase subunit A
MAFNKKKNHFFKKKYYECGFGSLSDINISININFLLIGVFLILYDIEFTFLFPFIINIDIVNIYSFAVFTAFYSLIIISLLYDWQRDALDWQY